MTYHVYIRGKLSSLLDVAMAESCWSAIEKHGNSYREDNHALLVPFLSKEYLTYLGCFSRLIAIIW